jgi:hypothetical protein
MNMIDVNCKFCINVNAAFVDPLKLFAITLQ